MNIHYRIEARAKGSTDPWKVAHPYSAYQVVNPEHVDIATERKYFHAYHNQEIRVIEVTTTIEEKILDL